MDIDQVAFLCLYAACLCMALHLMDENQVAAVGYTLEKRDSVAADLSYLMGKCFEFGDYGQRHRLEFIQAFM